MESKINGADVVISQTGFSGEKGYEIYVRRAHENAEIVWNGVLAAGEEFGLQVVAPAHHRRIAAGILSWGQDLDFETSPFQVNLSYQIPRNKSVDYIGKAELERQREREDKTQQIGPRMCQNGAWELPGRSWDLSAGSCCAPGASQLPF